MKTVIRRQFNDLTKNTETPDNIQIITFDDGEKCTGCNLTATTDEAWRVEIGCTGVPSVVWNHDAKRNTLIIVATWTA